MRAARLTRVAWAAWPAGAVDGNSARGAEQAEARLLVGIFFDGADYTIEDDTSLVDGNLRTYSDGRQVTTTIHWGHDYATLFHDPDPQEQETRQDRRELEEEVWPSGDPEPPCREPEDDTGEADVR